MQRSWTIGSRLALAFISVGIVLITTTVLSTVFVSEAISLKDRVIDVDAPQLLEITELERVVAETNSLSLSFLITGGKEQLDRYHATEGRSAEILQRLRGELSEMHDEQGAGLRDAIQAAEANHDAAVERLIKARQSMGELTIEQLHALQTEFEDDVFPTVVKLSEAVLAFHTYKKERENEDEAAADDAADWATALNWGGASITLLVLIAFGFILTRTMKTKLGGAAQDIASAATELQAAATQQSTSTAEQVSTFTEANTTLKEYVVTAQQIQESAQHVAHMSEECQRAGREGDGVVEEGRSSFALMQTQIDGVVGQILELGQKSQEIGAILDLVNELAEQTNILSVNATIEAAGAGEAGARFAAVASEIRALSDRVGQSTRDIRSLVESIHASVNGSVLATEASQKRVKAGIERFQTVAAAFAQIGELVNNTAQAGKEIELSTRQQTAAMEQLRGVFGDSQQAVKEINAATTQTTATAGQLVTLSSTLLRLVRRAEH